MPIYVPTYFDKRTTRRLSLYRAYSEAWSLAWATRPRKRAMLMLESEQYFAIVTQEEDGYLVSILKEPKQHKDSYIEVNVTVGHPMYARVHDICSMLNIAGPGVEVESVGEAYETALYKIIITKEENERLMES